MKNIITSLPPKKKFKLLASTAALSATLLGTLLAPQLARANAQLCETMFSSGPSTSLARLPQHPRIVEPEAVPPGYIQIGYESEYLFSESAKILRDYAPDAGEISEANWLKMSDEEHVNWLHAKFANVPEFAEDAGLHRLVNLPFTPEKVIVDSTGNLEIVMPPLDTYAEWNSIVDQITARYGVGSQQAMVSKPGKTAFVKGSPEARARVVQQHLGWLVYTNLRDMVTKMDSGYQRYLKNPTKLTAMSFEHPFVGPMTKIKRDVLEQFLRGNQDGQFFDEKSKAFVRKNDASFKYTSGPSYRPDIAAPLRFAWEIRNAHKDLADLKMKVHRDIVAHLSDLDIYSSFATVPAFDSELVFNQIPEATQTGLAKLFPSKANPEFHYDKAELISLETYRNFTLPLQNFSRLALALSPDAISAATLADRINRAQTIYRTELINRINQFSQNQLSADAAKARIMGAIGRFAPESGLSVAFDSFATNAGHEGALVAQQAAGF